MNDIKQKMIDFLLANANPSIKARIKSEILNKLSKDESDLYQRQIMQEKIINHIIAHQKENGWIGEGLHGGIDKSGKSVSQEGAVKYLAEKAIQKDTPLLKNAITAFLNTPLNNPCYGTRGHIYDEFSYAAFGMNIINCACIARAGYDDIIDITPQIQLSLDSFKRVLEVDSVFDISRPIRKGKLRVFNENEKWPCRYHHDILAHTNTWKNEVNIKILADSFIKMMKRDNKELIGYVPAVWLGNHAVGALGGYPSQGLTIKSTCLLPSPISIPYRDKPEYYNLEYIEWMARCGVVKYIPELQQAVGEIENSIDDNGICILPIHDEIFTGWGPYAGLQLEIDWKSKIRRDCDITFRALLIIHYFEQSL